MMGNCPEGRGRARQGEEKGRWQMLGAWESVNVLCEQNAGETGAPW